MKDQVSVEVRERAVVSTVKESDICLGYPVAVVYQSRGRKATKKCVE